MLWHRHRPHDRRLRPAWPCTNVNLAAAPRKRSLHALKPKKKKPPPPAPAAAGARERAPGNAPTQGRDKQSPSA